jgi:hypothetical protein
MRNTRTFIAAAALVLAAAAPTSAGAQGRGRGRGRPEPAQNPPGRRLTPQQQQQLIAQQRQRDALYRQRLQQQVAVEQERARQLQNARRSAQYAQQQRYLAALRAQQERLRAQRDYSRDPYYSTAPTYRYRLGSAYHETNQYGVDVLRQAVNNGYVQGVEAGRADRADHWQANYQNSYAYQDANYGYTGQYVDQSDYNYYFRQGFQRGYQDGYYGRSQYGSYSNGTGSILGNLLTSILGLQPLR